MVSEEAIGRAMAEVGERRGLAHEPSGPTTRVHEWVLNAAQPSLHVLRGRLPGGSEGLIAQQRYEVSDDGDTETVGRAYCLVTIPEAVAQLPLLYLRDAAFRRTRSYTVGPAGVTSNYFNVELESEKVNRRFAIQVRGDQDELWLRQLFSPTFVDWLGENVPEDVAFEVVEGSLCGYVGECLDDPARIVQLAEMTSHVAERIRSEALEDAGKVTATGPLPPPPETSKSRRIAERVAEVEFDEPPESMADAARAYRGRARREAGTLASAAIVGGIVYVICLGFGAVPAALFGGAWIGLGTALILVPVAGSIALIVIRSQTNRRSIAYGREAFVREYAAAHGLVREDPAAFHRRYLKLDLPGAAHHALRGAIDGHEARLLLCSDRSGAPGVGGHVVAVVGDRVVAQKPSSWDTGATSADLDEIWSEAAAARRRPPA